MEELVHQTWSAFLRFAEMMVKGLEQGLDYQTFQRDVETELNELGRTVMRLAIEGIDERLREVSGERPGWVIARRDDPKEMLTPFGMMGYRRTYFRHKKTGRHRYLADKEVGITAHQRIDMRVKGELVECATRSSYRESGQRWHKGADSWRVSGQTVMKTVRDVPCETKSSSSTESKRRVPYLFVQADEDHVGSQEGARWQPRLVTVHEGREGPVWRRRLVNPKHFGGLYHRRHEALWESVWHYLDETYDLEHVAAILISGDGARWIRSGCEYIPGSVFVLDRYHASQYVTKATGNNRVLYRRLWQALMTCKPRKMEAVLDEAREQAETQSKRQAIKDARRYFKDHWDGISAWKTFEKVWPGCSAEGQVSHVYAARMSSRPMAWGKVGVDQMSRLRVMTANGESARDTFIASHTKGLRPIRLSESRIHEMRLSLAKANKLSHMVTHNIPALEGSSPALRSILKAIVEQ